MHTSQETRILGGGGREEKRVRETHRFIGHTHHMLVREVPALMEGGVFYEVTVTWLGKKEERRGGRGEGGGRGEEGMEWKKRRKGKREEGGGEGREGDKKGEKEEGGGRRKKGREEKKGGKGRGRGKKGRKREGGGEEGREGKRERKRIKLCTNHLLV